MQTKISTAIAAGVIAALIAGPALAGPLCGGQSHEVSVPTETVSTDSGTLTIAESTTRETR